MMRFEIGNRDLRLGDGYRIVRREKEGALSDLLNDRTIWINSDPSLTDDGATFHNKDLWIGPRPFRIGRWTGLATGIHELAHIAGAKTPERPHFIDRKA